jgi:hypothetical protein
VFVDIDSDGVCSAPKSASVNIDSDGVCSSPKPTFVDIDSDGVCSAPKSASVDIDSDGVCSSPNSASVDIDSDAVGSSLIIYQEIFDDNATWYGPIGPHVSSAIHSLFILMFGYLMVQVRPLIVCLFFLFLKGNQAINTTKEDAQRAEELEKMELLFQGTLESNLELYSRALEFAQTNRYNYFEAPRLLPLEELAFLDTLTAPGNMETPEPSLLSRTFSSISLPFRLPALDCSASLESGSQSATYSPVPVDAPVSDTLSALPCANSAAARMQDEDVKPVPTGSHFRGGDVYVVFVSKDSPGTDRIIPNSGQDAAVCSADSRSPNGDDDAEPSNVLSDNDDLDVSTIVSVPSHMHSALASELHNSKLFRDDDVSMICTSNDNPGNNGRNDSGRHSGSSHVFPGLSPTQRR